MAQKVDTAELDRLLTELEQYNYTFIKEKVDKIRTIVQPLMNSDKDKEFRAVRKLKYSWGGVDPNSFIQATVTNLKSITNFNKEATEELRVLDNETQDILHALEFLDNTEEDMVKLSQDLTEIRKNRRKAKSFIELSSYLVDFVEYNKTAVKNLVDVSTNTQACFGKLERRTYTPREKTALAEAFEKLNKKEEEVK